MVNGGIRQLSESCCGVAARHELGRLFLTREGRFGAVPPVNESLRRNPALGAEVGAADVVILKLSFRMMRAFTLSVWRLRDMRGSWPGDGGDRGYSKRRTLGGLRAIYL